MLTDENGRAAIGDGGQIKSFYDIPNFHCVYVTKLLGEKGIFEKEKVKREYRGQEGRKAE